MTATITVLIADDQAHIRMPLEFLVGTLPGVRVLTACNGQEAVDLAVAHKPMLVLMDVMMPVLDGYTACQKIRAAWGTHPGQIWFITVRGSTMDTDQASAVGGQQCISKPFDPDKVLTQIRSYLQSCSGAVPTA